MGTLLTVVFVFVVGIFVAVFVGAVAAALIGTYYENKANKMRKQVEIMEEKVKRSLGC